MPGRTVELYQTPSQTGIRRFEEGQEYWVVVTPPLAVNLLPMVIGAGGRTTVLFAVPLGATGR